MFNATPSSARRRRRLGTALLPFAAVAALAACSDDGPETPAESEPAETTAPDSTAPETSTPGTTPEETTPDVSTPEGTADGELPTEETAADIVVGLTEEAAETAVAEQGWTLRVVSRDGEELPVTMDLRENRVNVEVTDGEVTAVNSIG